jgi:hypothetical protein
VLEACSGRHTGARHRQVLQPGCVSATRLESVCHACRRQFRVSTCHEQVATLVDMRDVGQPDAKLQSCKSAGPGMKVSGTDTDAVMGLVNGWWQEELQPDRCWAVIDVPGHMNVLLRYEKIGRQVITMPYVHP